MLFARKKTSVIDRRIKELGKEMARVRRELDTLAQPSSAKPGFPAEHAGAAPSGPGKAEDDLFAHAARQAPSGGSAPGERTYSTLFDQPDASPQSVRKRFANYFMAGHFQNLRPLRQENRVIRNKAIGMIIMVLLILLWLVYYFRTH
ncbi:MAG: hypothetical protein HYV35_04750 [Lentisphaerae bacterium]|nr:hypothetical protein [Lentisphaerota bacterium]